MNEPWYVSRLNKQGVSITDERQVVLSVLTRNQNRHLTVEDIYLAAHEEKPTIGIATVYRAVNLFVRSGILSKFEFGEGKARYEIVPGSDEPGHHHHLICKKCQKILNYEDFMEEEQKFVEMVQSGLEERYHFRIEDHIIQFYGYCEECLKKEDHNPKI